MVSSTFLMFSFIPTVYSLLPVENFDLLEVQEKLGSLPTQITALADIFKECYEETQNKKAEGYYNDLTLTEAAQMRGKIEECIQLGRSIRALQHRLVNDLDKSGNDEATLHQVIEPAITDVFVRHRKEEMLMLFGDAALLDKFVEAGGNNNILKEKPEATVSWTEFQKTDGYYKPKERCLPVIEGSGTEATLQ